MLIDGSPSEGQDCRELWTYVDKLVKSVNALLNMTGRAEGAYTGVATLRVIDNYAELRFHGPVFPYEAGEVNKKHTDCVVASSDSPSDYGETIHFIAAVAVDATGTIQFYIDGDAFDGPRTVSGGLAFSPDISDLDSGPHAITAHYSGDSQYLDSWSSDFTQMVRSLNPPVVQVVATPNPAEKGIDFVKFIAAVVGQNPIPPAPPITGSVRFFIDNSNFADRVLVHYSGNEWRCDTSDDAINYLEFGNHNILALYLGDQHYGTAYDTTVLKVELGSAVTLSFDPDYVEPNNDTTATVVVTASGLGRYPTGQVELFKEGAAYAFADLVNGQAQISVPAGPTEGDQTWSAYYYGEQYVLAAVSANVILHVQAEMPLPYSLVITPNQMNGGAGLFTFETINIDNTHNNFSGPLDMLAVDEWQPFGYMLISVNNGSWVQLVPGQATGPVATLLFVGGYANNVQILVSGYTAETLYGTLSFRGVRRGVMTDMSTQIHILPNP